MVDNQYLDQIRVENKKNIFCYLRGTTGKHFFTKKKSRVFSKKNTWFCSEFDADSNHVIGFQKCWGRENGLTTTCPLGEPAWKHP